MTLAEILQQAKTLSAQEQKELIKRLVDELGLTESSTARTVKTGAEISRLLIEMEPVELVDPDIIDSVEWVKAQRLKEASRLKPFWDGEA